MSNDFDIPLHQLRGLSINDEDVTELVTRVSSVGTSIEEAAEIAALISPAGIKVDEAAEGLRKLNRSLLSTHTATAKLSMEFDAVEQRMIVMMQAEAGGGLLNQEDLYGPGEWREIGKQRARKLRRRGEHVEPTFLGYRWWKRWDPYRVAAAEMFGVPYAEAHPHLRKQAKPAFLGYLYGMK